jgi:hypothetical protein
MSCKTYFIDVDGTIVKHISNDEIDRMIAQNQFDFEEILLPGIHELWKQFDRDDKIIITTARREAHRTLTEKIFKTNNLRFDVMLMDLPSGPRILINDTPNMLYKKAIAINVKRDTGFY